MRVLALALILAMAQTASAWNDCGTPGSARDVENVASPNGRRVICHDTAAAVATDSGLLSVAQCDHLTIHFDPDADGTATGATAYIYGCTYPSASSTYCSKLLVDTDGDGIPNDVTLDGSTLGQFGQQWQSAAWIWVDMQSAPGSGDYARTMIVCH